MPLAFHLCLALQDQIYRPPAFFTPVFLVLLLASVLGWLAATVVGFTHARAAGRAALWFALASACMLLFSLHFLLTAFLIALRNADWVLVSGAFLFLFVVLGAICTIIGFMRSNDPRH